MSRWRFIAIPVLSLALVATSGFASVALTAEAGECATGAVKPDGGGADGYYTCVAGSWVHTVPTFDPNSADGYGPNQPMPPFCIRHRETPCPTGTPSGASPAESTADVDGFISFLQQHGEELVSAAARNAAVNLGRSICEDYDSGMSNSAVGSELMAGSGGFSANRAARWTTAAVIYLCPAHKNLLGS